MKAKTTSSRPRRAAPGKTPPVAATRQSRPLRRAARARPLETMDEIIAHETKATGTRGRVRSATSL